jgi:uncharacterized protein
MKILLIGASGMVGSRVAAEAVGRGHEVTAVTRRGGEVGNGLTAVAGDASDPAAVARLAAGHDAVVSAVAPPRDGSEPAAAFHATYRAILEGVRTAGVRRLVVVGGAGGLEVAPGLALVDTPDFPAMYKKESLAQRDLYEQIIRPVTDLDWTYFAPSAEIAPGERTGAFRLGSDQLLVDDAGKSFISAEDFSVAIVDELEKGNALRRRITVGH